MGVRMSAKRLLALVAVAAVAGGILYAYSGPRSGSVLDEARLAQRTAASFTPADEDFFREVDGGIQLTPEEVKGRNTWLVWTGGNDRLWDRLINYSRGNFDLLKVLSSYPGLQFSRDSRWNYFGVLNEPCFEKATMPNRERFGLWLDVRRQGCPADPFENEAKYPGVKIGARGKNIPVGSFYGYASGILGLRLFPNPDFDEAAQRAWDPVRFYTDPSYYTSKDLIRPYRVGMACSFCHIGPNPVKPPDDPENPKWENMSSLVGAQYYWVDRIFVWNVEAKNFLYQLMATSRPGALDASQISTDYITNPRTMNAIYHVGARLKLALEFGKETLAGGNLDSKQFNDYVANGALTEFFRPPSTIMTPRVLKDGSDSIGVLPALNRVYLNIGLFSEEWLLHFNPLAGGTAISPIRVKIARENSSYWQSTEDQMLNMARFLMKADGSHRLADAPGGAQYLVDDKATLDRGKTVFAERCARCHSSKYPTVPAEADPGRCEGPNYLQCWNQYWAWTKTDGYKSAMRDIVAADDFLKDNYLSNDLRVPVSLLQTNLCSPLATNSIQGNIWDDFSSQTYKDLPSVGDVSVVDPLSGDERRFSMPAGGRGYTRVPSLVSLWSTAPFLLNNSVGRFDPDPSTAGRMRSFDDSIRKMLWPERRERDAKLGQTSPGTIDRLPEPAYLDIPLGQLPGPVQSTIGFLAWLAPDLFHVSTRRYDFSGTIIAGSAAVTDVQVAAPLATFHAGSPVSGPGIPPGSRAAGFDAASRVLTLDHPATVGGRNVALQTDALDSGVRFGPIPAGTPVTLLSNLELAPESGGFVDWIAHTYKLLGVLWGVRRELNALNAANSQTDRDGATRRLNDYLLSMNKCPDFVVNRGHYFGTSSFSEEPGLGDADKEALIAFLKTF
jgi:hypothetical protein